MTSQNLNDKMIKNVQSVIPKRKQDLLKWYGWGYKDSGFYIKEGQVRFAGNRYPIGGEKHIPGFQRWVEEKFDVYPADHIEPPKLPRHYPEPIIDEDFMRKIKELKIEFSTSGDDRFVRCHGQTLHDIHLTRTHGFERIPDVIVWPTCHNDVVSIISIANEYNIAIVPYGGGTSVSGAVTTPQNEKRSIVVLDTTQMNRMLWLDRENLVACFESGIVGQDLDRILNEEGFTLGHEPDSVEFSTLGGWVATRASGMKKNVYGNIEDIVVRVKMVTSKGVLERNISAPRVSCGPDFNEIILGSEGTLGVVTEVLIKIRPLPAIKKYGSLVFPNFESGVRCVREIAKKRCQPASIRLMDNEQFKFGQGLKTDNGFFSNLTDYLKKFALTKIKGLDLDKICVATLLFEGEKEEVERQEKMIFEIAGQHHGFSAGATNGMKGYVLTYVIAYIRDLALDFGIVAESFETSVPWDKCEKLCSNVKAVVNDECKKLGIKYYLISCRVTQTYDAGACVYFYFGFRYNTQQDPVHTYEEIENKARDVVIASGGSISHHHGIGKIRSKWYKQSVSSVGVQLYKSAKLELDPKNIFAAGNLLPTEDAIDFESNLKSKL